MDARLLRSLTREVRNAQGIERTPTQIATVMRKKYQFPDDAARKILASADLTQQFAFSLRYSWQDGLPSSTELMDHRWG